MPRTLAFLAVALSARLVSSLRAEPLPEPVVKSKALAAIMAAFVADAAAMPL